LDERFGKGYEIIGEESGVVELPELATNHVICTIKLNDS